MTNQANSPAPVKRALISVSDKTGIVEFSKGLHEIGVEILSTGGTARTLLDNGIPVIEVSSYTGFPEMMDGRVKTLHPKIHGGILGRRGIDDQIMSEHDISAIDMVVVNLYPFAETVAKPDCTLEDAIENIDIGGPTMVRAAAKNYRDVAIITAPSDYTDLLQSLQEQRGFTETQRFSLAKKAFQHTAEYDGMIANHLGLIGEDNQTQTYPDTLDLHFKKAQDLRYGENPHQNAAFYISNKQQEHSISTARQHQGKALSYNNIADTDAALSCIKQFDETACVIVKHANPCGVAISNTQLGAYNLAYSTDPESAFGGIIAFNSTLTAETAKAITDRQFVEVIIAPSVDDAALEVIASKKNLRLLTCGPWKKAANQLDYKRVTGGLLVQDADLALTDKLEVVTQRAPTEQEMQDLLFSWKVAKFVKSNAIVYAKNQFTIGVGAGQMSRINSARIAAIKAEHAKLEVTGAVMASDAFFPFRDGIDNAASVGISAVIQPGGSVRDEEVIDAANEHGLAMVFTGMRHFRH